MQQNNIDGRAIIALPDQIDGASSAGGFAFGMHKAGSTMLLSVMRRLSRFAGVKQVDVNRILAEAGIALDTAKLSENEVSVIAEWLRQPGILFVGWRRYPRDSYLPLAPQLRTHLLVRDPRDIVTSFYFSVKYSHTTAGLAGPHVEEMRRKYAHVDIDSFVLQEALRVRKRFREYEPLKGTHLLLRRYEDIIFDKRMFLSDICTHFQISVPPAALERLAEAIDKRPAREDVHAHIRQVAPGDHRRKLKPETIAELNDIFADVLLVYDYSRDVRD